MSATKWEVLDRTRFEACWGRISVAVPVVYLTMLNLWVVRGGGGGTDTIYCSVGMQQMNVEVG